MNSLIDRKTDFYLRFDLVPLTVVVRLSLVVSSCLAFALLLVSLLRIGNMILLNMI